MFKGRTANFDMLLRTETEAGRGQCSDRRKEIVTVRERRLEGNDS